MINRWYGYIAVFFLKMKYRSLLNQNFAKQVTIMNDYDDMIHIMIFTKNNVMYGADSMISRTYPLSFIICFDDIMGDMSMMDM